MQKRKPSLWCFIATFGYNDTYNILYVFLSIYLSLSLYILNFLIFSLFYFQFSATYAHL